MTGKWFKNKGNTHRYSTDVMWPDVMWSIMGLHLFKPYIAATPSSHQSNGMLWQDEINYFYNGIQFMIKRVGRLVSTIPDPTLIELQKSTLNEYMQ